MGKELKVIEAEFKLPEIVVKEYYAGFYYCMVGGTILVLFDEEPVAETDWIAGKELTYYCLYTNVKITAGHIYLSELREVYPDVDFGDYLINEQAKEIEITEIFKIKIGTLLDDNGSITQSGIIPGSP